MIEIQNLSKSYTRNAFAVENVSLKCEKGITALIGLNGAGKSTILKCITSFLYPDDGKILISDSNGNFFTSEDNSAAVKKHIGFVPEHNILPKKITVRELLNMTLDCFGISELEKSMAFEKTVKACFLTDVLDKKIGNLSKGYIQRTLLANAIIYEPENLILDEASSGLDPSQIIQFRNLLKEYSKNHTVLISTHIMQEVSALCDKIYVIREGKIASYGREKELIQKTKTKTLEEAFLVLNNIENTPIKESALEKMSGNEVNNE